jgi:flavin reductase (DIM6/NTAB) family NADH-FMN oxidoreductase RutF
MRLKKEQIEALDDRYRALFINALSGFKSANLVASCDNRNNTNLAIFTSVFHIGSHPPLLGMVSRPHAVARHTLENILQTEHYTINHVNKSIYQQAHQTSARYDRETSEFQAAGLSEQWDDGFPVPFVKESRIQLGMRLREHHQLTINNTVLIIGEITYINIKDDIVQQDGYVAIERIKSVVVSSLDSYHCTDLLSRLPYAKP